MKYKLSLLVVLFSVIFHTQTMANVFESLKPTRSEIVTKKQVEKKCTITIQDALSSEEISRLIEEKTSAFDWYCWATGAELVDVYEGMDGNIYYVYDVQFNCLLLGTDPYSQVHFVQD